MRKNHSAAAPPASGAAGHGLSGQITVFLALISLLIFGLLTGTLEGARQAVLRLTVHEAADGALMSFFAAYHSEVLEEYGLLVRPAEAEEDWTETVASYARRSLTPGDKTSVSGADRVRLEELTVKAESTLYLTDASGLAFEEAVLAYMKTSGLAALLQEAMSRLGLYDASGSLDFSEALKQLLAEENTDPEALLDNYDSLTEQAQSLKEAEKQRQQETGAAKAGDAEESDAAAQSGTETGETAAETAQTPASSTETDGSLTKEQQQTKEEAEDFWETLRSLKENGLVSLITGDTELSGLKWEGEKLPSALSETEKQENTALAGTERSWDKKLLLGEYLLHKMSCYTDGQSEGHRYEIEYVLTGKSTEAQALRAVVTRLLALRSSLDLVYLLTDSARMAEAEALAVLLVGAWAPSLIPGMKYLLLAVWALTEGVSDVRRLLKGQKLPLWKDAADWRMDLLSLNFSEASSRQGLGYEDYLRLLYYIGDTEDCSYRMMDVIQTRIGDSLVLSDCLVQASCSFTVRTQTLYMVVPPFRFLGKSGWTFTYKSAYGY